MSAIGGKADIDTCAGEAASILFLFSPLFRGIPHLMKYVERKESHPLLLVGAQSFVERLPRTSKFLEVG